VHLREIDESMRADALRLLEPVGGSVLAAKRLAAKGELRGVETDQGLAACVVTSPRGDGAVVIEAISVAPERRGQGVGRAVVETLAAGETRLVAEAAEDAVGFFRACGFSVRSEGGTPYRRRYVCELG
jgi:ribosomal protein S18 acetylase RimI-like enzyme